MSCIFSVSEEMLVEIINVSEKKSAIFNNVHSNWEITEMAMLTIQSNLTLLVRL